MRTRQDEGFTLVELLLVTLLIGVLAAIAMPSLLSTRIKAYHAAMSADLHSLVVSETAWNTGNNGYTTDTTLLGGEGFRQTKDVIAHVAVAGATFVACTRHSAVTDWLVFDSATSQITSSPTDCA